MFVDRERELRELNALFERRFGQLLTLHGRRRVGKSALLLRWARQAEWPYIYWLARRNTQQQTRRGFAEALARFESRQRGEALGSPLAFASWERAFQYMRDLIGERPTIIIFDEFPYAVEADSALPSEVQAAWDLWFQNTNVVWVLAGSHISMMHELREADAPLYGRFTAELPLKPLPYRALAAFFPTWSPAERIATYAVIGGIPAYLRQFDRPTLVENIKAHLFSTTGMFRNETTTLIADLVRATGSYEAVLRAVAKEAYTHSDIAEAAGMSSPQVSPYLRQLQDLGLIERRVPATVPLDKRDTSKRGRYYLADPFLRFYYRFVEPEMEAVQLEMIDVLWEEIREQFRSFIGATAFEELSREWVRVQAIQGTQRVPFRPQVIGEHWRHGREQIDVVAVNWKEQQILFGECKWGKGTVGVKVIRELVRKSRHLIPGADWTVHYAFFAREGFSRAARAEVDGAVFVTADQLDADLQIVL